MTHQVHIKLNQEFQQWPLNFFSEIVMKLVLTALAFYGVSHDVPRSFGT